MENSQESRNNLKVSATAVNWLQRINQSIEKGEFAKISDVLQVFDDLKFYKNPQLHIMILASKGGLESHINHLYAFLEITKSQGAKPWVHLFSDGRDVPKKQFLDDLPEMEAKIKEAGAMLASISGRFYAMDRDENWDRTEKVLKVLVKHKGTPSFKVAKDYINSQYESGTTDEWIVPGASEEYLNSLGLKQEDVIVFLNFRFYRARQLSHLLVDSADLYAHRSQLTPENLSLYTMTDYEKIFVAGIFFEK